MHGGLFTPILLHIHVLSLRRRTRSHGYPFVGTSGGRGGGPSAYNSLVQYVAGNGMGEECYHLKSKALKMCVLVTTSYHVCVSVITPL